MTLCSALQVNAMLRRSPTTDLRFLHNILLFRRGVEGGAWRTPGWRSWQTLSSVMVVLAVLSAFVTTAALTVLLQGSLTGKLVLVAPEIAFATLLLLLLLRLLMLLLLPNKTTFVTRAHISIASPFSLTK